MSKPPRRIRVAVPVLAVLAGLAAGACLYDPGQRCGPAMTYDAAANACLCASDAIAVAGGCQRCPAGEVGVGASCGCPVGQAKTAGGCVVITGLGDACDTASTPCTSAKYSYCAARGGGTAGTCTSRCAANTDCDAAYTCATWDAQPSCRTFAGFGAPCTAPADCVGDVNFCDTLVSHSCGIAGCSLTENNCPRGTTCCDFSAYQLGNLCAGMCL